jgi:hypothetical protein
MKYLRSSRKNQQHSSETTRLFGHIGVDIAQVAQDAAIAVTGSSG